MPIRTLVWSDTQAREATLELQELHQALSTEQALAAIVKGLPPTVINVIRKALATERRELTALLDAYHQAKAGDFRALKKMAGSDPGAALIVARIERGLSQKELARKLGLREQAVQRYEAEKYRSINLTGFLKFASVLEVDWRKSLASAAKDGWMLARDISPAEMRKVLKHARANGWFPKDNTSDDDGLGKLKRDVADHVTRYGTPSLLRTGLNVEGHSEDWLLLAWKAHVSRRAEEIAASRNLAYRPLEVSWLLDLVRLSQYSDGPERAIELLLEHGIVLIVEAHIPGMGVDGAAFLLDGLPVIGLTLRRDSLDSFWFSLMHEVAHIVLHYRTGLASGFFDSFDSPTVDELEGEANTFAGNLLIPEEQWRRAPARIAKKVEPIEAFARQIGIHPAIVFGRIRMERNNYALFSNQIGHGQLRKRLLPTNREVT
jgi:HTH-type transcriptional regulator/antitoxin HigA